MALGLFSFDLDVQHMMVNPKFFFYFNFKKKKESSLRRYYRSPRACGGSVYT